MEGCFLRGEVRESSLQVEGGMRLIQKTFHPLKSDVRR